MDDADFADAADFLAHLAFIDNGRAARGEDQHLNMRRTKKKKKKKRKKKRR